MRRERLCERKFQRGLVNAVPPDEKILLEEAEIGEEQAPCYS
jgi:hypothetical protein